MIRKYEDAEDIPQETFIKAFNNLSRYRKEYRFNTWLYKIISNLCIDLLWQQRFQHISIETPYPTQQETNPMEFVDDGVAADKELVLTQEQDMLRNLLTNLPNIITKLFFCLTSMSLITKK